MTTLQSEEEFKLPLRQWLKSKLDQNNQEDFPGLSWISKKEQIFKIPWTQKGHPGWEKHYQIFKAWAIHRGTDEAKLNDHKKLKGNFRCAMNKSDDFEEIKSKNVTGQQTGNYKVFKLLTPEEVKQKSSEKKKAKPSDKSRKRPHSTPSSTVKLDSLGDPELKKAPETFQEFQTTNQGESVMKQPTMTEIFNLNCEGFEHLEHLEHFLGEISNNLQADDFFSNPSEPSLILPPAQINSLHVVPPPPTTQSRFLETRILSAPTQHTERLEDPIGLYAQEVLVSPLPASSEVIIAPEEKPEEFQLQSFESLQVFLDKFKIPTQRLSHFGIRWRYDKGTIPRPQPLDLSVGCRILYGNPDLQKAMVDVSNRQVEGFNWESHRFPPYNGSNKNVRMILQNADLGLLLKFDYNVLRAYRLCQSQVFYFDKNEENGPAIKMERGRWYEIFSYSKYIRRLLAQGCIDSDVTLIIGMKPSSRRSATLVSLTMEPLLAPCLKEHFSSSNSSSLLAISQQTSLDELIRMLDGFEMSNNISL